MYKDTWFSHSSEKMCIKYIRFLFFLVRESSKYDVNSLRRNLFSSFATKKQCAFKKNASKICWLNKSRIFAASKTK